jgi:hypothetical protein
LPVRQTSTADSEDLLVAQTYAGFLGLVAFVVAIADGWIHGAGPQTALFRAWLSLLAFTAIGYAIGAVAGQVIDDAVRSRVAAQLAADPPTRTTKPGPIQS